MPVLRSWPHARKATRGARACWHRGAEDERPAAPDLRPVAGSPVPPEPPPRLREKDLFEVMYRDLVGSAASILGDELAGRRPQRSLFERDIGCSADLVGQQSVDARIVIVELDKFRRDVAGWLQGACAISVHDRDVGGAAGN